MPLIAEFDGVLEVKAQIEARKAKTGELNLGAGTRDAAAEAAAVRSAAAAKAAAAKTSTKAPNYVKETVKLD